MVFAAARPQFYVTPNILMPKPRLLFKLNELFVRKPRSR